MLSDTSLWLINLNKTNLSNVLHQEPAQPWYGIFWFGLGRSSNSVCTLPDSGHPPRRLFSSQFSFLWKENQEAKLGVCNKIIFLLLLSHLKTCYVFESLYNSGCLPWIIFNMIVPWQLCFQTIYQLVKCIIWWHFDIVIIHHITFGVGITLGCIFGCCFKLFLTFLFGRIRFGGL